jgi:alpha-amylase/alpha-mannosidase (GH57 family)
MWLPETAVDTEPLEVLAANGIKFTILAPRQAKRFRRRDARTWHDVTGDQIDPSRAYLVQLPSKRSISVFFYDGPISQGVAFEGLLDDGRRFADRLLSGFSDARQWPQLVHIATDGESYGHHHRYGEMALSYAQVVPHLEGAHLPPGTRPTFL